MFESLQALKGEQSETRAGHGSSHVTVKVGFQQYRLATPVIGMIVTLEKPG